jgi:hypothetical protein
MIKKVFMCVSVLSLLLTACSKDEVIAPVADSSKAIGFGTVLAPANRGAIFNKGALQNPDYGFSVSAYNQGVITDWDGFKGTLTANPVFMDNTKVTWDNPVWGYSPKQYWPGKINATDYGRVTFFALGGLESDDLTITYNASHLPVFEYTTEPAAANQSDLVADVVFNRHWGHADGNTVKFTFKHILSKIGFTAQLAEDYSGTDNTKVKVTGLKVNYTADKVKSNGIYAFNTTFGATGSAALGSWTPGSTTLSDDSEELIISGGVELNTDASDLNRDDRFLMLIPQTITDAGDLTVEFTCEITTGTSPNEQTVIYPVFYQLPAIEYVIGKQYTYNFTLTLRPITFDVDVVVAWEDGDQS